MTAARHPIEKVVPETYRVTPSRIDPWRGGWSAAGRFTGEQLRKLPALGLDPATVETVLVRSKATTREMWWPTGSPAPEFRFECPVIGRRRDGRLLILAPAGIACLVAIGGRPKRGEPLVERIEQDPARDAPDRGGGPSSAPAAPSSSGGQP